MNNKLQIKSNQMGCFSSKPSKQEFNQEEVLFADSDYSTHHVVSLTSTTYGLLKMDTETETSVVLPNSQEDQEPEIINTWELMQDLEDEIPISSTAKKSPSSSVLHQSSQKHKKFAGKENMQRQSNGGLEGSPIQNLCSENLKRVIPILKIRSKSTTPLEIRTESFRFDVGFSTPPRQGLSPLFDPELVAFFEAELEEQEEQIKNVITFPTTGVHEANCSGSLLELFEKESSGEDNSVLIYTTTLRGIRKTFEDCNVVRSVIESHQVYMIEKDVSMDSGFRDELRVIMGKQEITVPVVFVKGRLIGGAEEVVKMEEEGKLRILFEGIPGAIMGCEGCAGIRFVMCMDCNGSRKVLDEEQRKMVRCEECNENGLIQCPICC